MEDSSYLEHGRMDWGFGNPNKTAALIALLMIAVWGLAYIRKWGFWAALTLFTGFGSCLILTQSRGAAVAILIGGLITVGWAPRPFSFQRSLAVVLACMALAVFVWLVNADSRYTQGFLEKDRSIDNRLLIWRQVPAMIQDAPNGWGLGKSGDAYMQWYQPITRGEGYRTLVNSHLTWLVELDWPGRIVYIFCWVAIFILIWPPSSKEHWFSIPCSIWTVFAICACFSSVAEAFLLWIVPVIALFGVMVARFRCGLWPKENTWLWGAFAAGTIIASIWIGGMLILTHSIIHCPRPGVVILGTSSPRIWIVAPNRSVLGEHYGHEIRRAYEATTVYQHEGLGIVTLPKNVPANQTLVFSAQPPASLGALHPAKIILINPPPISNGEIKALTANPSITVIVGEFSQNKEYWSQQSQEHPNIKIQLVTGSEEYIPNWMQEIATAVKGWI